MKCPQTTAVIAVVMAAFAMAAFASGDGDTGKLYGGISGMNSVKDKSKLTEALKVANSKTALPEQRRKAVRRLLESGNDDLALQVISPNSGEWLDFLETKRNWDPTSIRLLIRALLKIAIDDVPRPGGEEQASQSGAVYRLSVLLQKGMKQHGSDVSDIHLTEPTHTQVKRWLSDVVSVSLQRQPASSPLRTALEQSEQVIRQEHDGRQ